MVARLHGPLPGSISARHVAAAVLAAALVGVGLGVALHELRSGGAPAASRLPAFHGQAVWASGERPAPRFTLRDERGAPLSLSSLHGRPVLLTFLDSRCRNQCPVEGRELASVFTRLPAASRPALLVVSVDPRGDTPASIRHAMRSWGLAGRWRWHWLNGSRAQLEQVWRAYGITVDPASGDIVHSLVLYLIDRRGDERTAYLFPFLPGFLQRDLAALARAGA